MASEAELNAVFTIFRNDQTLLLEATRALEWAAERVGVNLTADEKRRYALVLVASEASLRQVDVGIAEIQCASKGCGGGSYGCPTCS